MPVPMISLRDFTLRSKTGHTIFFEGGKPTPVPEEVVAEAMAFNIAVTDGLTDREAALKFKPTDAQSVITGTLRDAIIFGALDELVRENDSDNFNAGGQPKVHALYQVTGVKLTGGEVSKFWERYREIKSTNSDLPTHPRVENVLELQRLTTRAQLVEYAKDMGFDVAMIDRKTLKEAKEALMYATINFHEAATPAPAPRPDTSTLEEND